MIVDWDPSEYTRLSFEDYDCWQLIRKIYREKRQIELPSFKLVYNGPSDLANIKRLTCDLGRTMWQQVTSPRVNDLVLFRIYNVPCHLGICIDDRKREMIHTMKGVNVVKECFAIPSWQKRTEGIFRYVG